MLFKGKIKIFSKKIKKPTEVGFYALTDSNNYACVFTLPAAALDTITIAGRITRPFSS